MKGVIVEEVATEEDEDGELAAIVVAVRVPRREAGRCGVCRRRRPGYDQGALIALALLSLGGLCPPLPGRS